MAAYIHSAMILIMFAAIAGMIDMQIPEGLGHSLDFLHEFKQ